ncbi:roundabout homolog 1-like [Syngnathus typhle]|uniref:roundabout homolog 1-like n=1 Tax=Syngnathus typhle TaxID=161592 RepID=UPI002A6B1221|nr:roundabout homolog 1-like [Syngnathus typhle]
MKLVIIILLLCVHSADPVEVCNGVKNQVVFCPNGQELKLDTQSTGVSVTWTFNGKSLPNGITHPDTANKKDLNIASLTAEHTGLYKATYAPSKEDKFTIIVDAVTCIKNVPCDVAVGASIKMDSELEPVNSWTLKKSDGSDTEVNEAEKFTATNKKVLGLFKLKTEESGTYKATKNGQPDIVVEFPVSVTAKNPVSSVKIKKQGGKAHVCPADKVEFECTVGGDAKSYTWTKDKKVINAEENIELSTNKLTIKSATSGDSGSYACKVKGYDSKAMVTSPSEVLTVQDSQAVSGVRITQDGRTLQCAATGGVKHFKWQMEDGTKVPPQHGSVGGDDSVFNLTPKAKGNFVCEATGCNDKAEKSEFFGVSEGAGSDTNNKKMDGDKPGEGARGLQGASTSVALLLICVLVELYVMML